MSCPGYTLLPATISEAKLQLLINILNNIGSVKKHKFVLEFTIANANKSYSVSKYPLKCLPVMLCEFCQYLNTVPPIYKAPIYKAPIYKEPIYKAPIYKDPYICTHI